MSGVVRHSRWWVLLIGVMACIGIAIITGIQGCGSADKYGKVPIPGERAIDFDKGSYTVYYQEHTNLGENDSLGVPSGIKLGVRGLGGAPKPTLDLGGGNSQIAVNDKVSVSIGKLKIPADGRYGVVVGPSPRPADRPAITFGETFGKTAARGGKRIGLVALLTIALFVVLAMMARRVRGSDPSSYPAAPAGSGAATEDWIPSSPPRAPPPAPAPAAPTALPPVESTPGTDSRLAAVEQLADMHKRGLLSDAEFERLKKQYLA